MARPLRIEFPGAVYHVTSRGNERRPIVRDDEDREMFVQILAEVVHRFGLKLYAWVLMTNHYHLFLKTPDPCLSRAMHRLNQRYAEYFNWRHRRVGHLFQGRFKAFLVDSESYFLEVARYVVLNPVRAGMRKTAAGYKWSSYRATAGLASTPDWLAADELLETFDCWDRQAARNAYREFVAAAGPEEDPWRELVGGWILGSESFVARVRGLIDETKKDDPEYPKVQRYVGRPSIEKVAAAVAKHCETPIDRIRNSHGGLARMLTAGLAVDEALSTLRPVARILGLRSPSHVSSLARTCRAQTASSPDLRELQARIVKDLYPPPRLTFPGPAPPHPPASDAPF